MDIFHQPLRNRFFDSLNTPYYLIVAVLLRPWIGQGWIFSADGFIEASRLLAQRGFIPD